MKTTVVSILTITGVALLCGCVSHPNRVTNGKHPGPAAGFALGTAVGSVGGNVTAGVVGFGEGVVVGSKGPFSNDKTQRYVRHWHTETTSDGRVIQVAEDIAVDEQGRPVERKGKR